MKVYLLGAGPGDPGLLTLKARDALAAADVVVYDALANDSLLGHARPAAALLYESPGSRAATPTFSGAAAKKPRNCWPRACPLRKCRASAALSRPRPTRAFP